MRIKNYKKISKTAKFVRTMLELGFIQKKRPNNTEHVLEWCYQEEGQTTRSAPQIFILENDEYDDDDQAGIIMIYMATQFYYRRLPDVIFKMMEKGLIEMDDGIKIPKTKGNTLHESRIHI